MIITEEAKLKLMCEEVKTITEGEEIGAQLLTELSKSENGIGLAANQIGINKRVCVINVKDPVVLINPKIVKKTDEPVKELNDSKKILDNKSNNSENNQESEKKIGLVKTIELANSKN